MRDSFTIYRFLGQAFRQSNFWLFLLGTLLMTGCSTLKNTLDLMITGDDIGFRRDAAYAPWKRRGFTREEMQTWSEPSETGTYEAFIPGTAAVWKEADFEPRDAIAFRRADCQIGEALRWKEAGFSGKTLDFRYRGWKRLGFSPETGRPWRVQGFDDLSSSEWWAVEFTPWAASEWSKNGISPENARLLSDAGFTAKEGRRWLDAGLESEEAAEKYKSKLGFEQATKWAGISAEYVSGWEEASISPEDARRWTEKGYTPSGVIKKIARDRATRKICPAGVFSIYDLLTAGPYSVDGNCYEFGAVVLQVLGPHQALVTISQNNVFHADFGTMNVPAENSQFMWCIKAMQCRSVAKGVGVYRYRDVSGSERTVPSMKRVVLK